MYLNYKEYENNPKLRHPYIPGVIFNDLVEKACENEAAERELRRAEDILNGAEKYIGRDVHGRYHGMSYCGEIVRVNDWLCNDRTFVVRLDTPIVDGFVTRHAIGVSVRRLLVDRHPHYYGTGYSDFCMLDPEDLSRTSKSCPPTEAE